MSSSDTSNSSYAPVKPMVVSAPPQGSNGSIQQNNTALTNQNTQRQMAARFGGSRKKQRGGLVVPPVKVSYVETGVGNTNTSNNVTASARTQADLSAQAKLDSDVGPIQPIQKAGKSRRLVGGWPAWGCMSGGKKRRGSRSRRLKSRKLKSRKLKSRKLRKSSYRRRKSK
jgi:hypothetical protein